MLSGVTTARGRTQKVKNLFIIPLVLMSLVSSPSWGDHIFVPYLDNYEEECKIGQVAPTGCYCTRDAKTGKCTETPLSQDKIWNSLKKKQHEEHIKAKAFNKCMFKNIKPTSNAAHYKTVRQYCKDQAGE
jgi:hypothetical protein